MLCFRRHEGSLAVLQFRERAHEAVDYICDYYDRVDTFSVRSDVEVI